MRPLKTRFRSAYTYRLKLATKTNSLTHYTKGTPSHNICALTACKHSVSGSISLLFSRFFSPFPHGTCSLSVDQEYLGLEGGPPFFKRDYTCPALLMLLKVRSLYRTITFFGYPFQNIRISYFKKTGLVRVRSPLLTESRLISFPPATEMFQFAGFASCPYVFRTRYHSRGGFPHSDIDGSKVVRTSPSLFAAYHVFLRL